LERKMRETEMLQKKLAKADLKGENDHFHIENQKEMIWRLKQENTVVLGVQKLVRVNADERVKLKMLRKDAENAIKMEDKYVELRKAKKDLEPIGDAVARLKEDISRLEAKGKKFDDLTARSFNANRQIQDFERKVIVRKEERTGRCSNASMVAGHVRRGRAWFSITWLDAIVLWLDSVILVRISY